MKKIVAFLALGTLFIATPIRAGLMNDLKNLTGMRVIAAGDARAEDCPSAMTHDCAAWPRGIYSIGYNVCFQAIQSSCGMSCQGILAIDSRQQAYFFAKDAYGSDFTQTTARIGECPPAY